ncbi:heavy metal translocating P-type ATPase [uncultured Ruminococcus sp.]|uniref:heavy metal translocating P-type ATPase n=1 Tax=uncultured Ruminococcus sp. TaxID=165186 RepID=UPI0025E6F56A|nr:heavy metal translocating P-type ATPase [uncultured Ruminococcus sp.]
MKKFNVTGMSCAACSSRVEKAVSKVNGVKSVSVSLLTNSMGVEGSASDESIIAAVEKAGYGASVAGGEKKQSAENEQLKDKDTPVLMHRLIASVGFLAVLMYISMGHMMLGWPLPNFFTDNHIAMGLVQLLLCVIIMVINQKFFINGFKGLIHRSPNMDTLVALGSGASFVYSVYALFAMTDAQVKGNADLVMSYMHEFYFESAAMILTLITVGKMLEAHSRGKTTNALKALLNLAPKKATLLIDGKETEVTVDKVKKGDVFVVRPGESIPVDAEITDGSTAVDESALTGESIPVDKTVDDSVSAGTINKSGFIKCSATAVGEDTALSQIIKMVSDAAATKAPVAKIADKVSGVFVPVVIVIAVVTIAVWLLCGQTVGYALARGISVLVISCPCALGLATPVAIMVGNGMGARKGILFKTASSLEVAGKIQIAVLDKTGTITKGEPKVTDVIPFGISENELLQYAYSIETKSEHPLAKAVIAKAQEIGLVPYEITDFKAESGNGLSGEYNGEKIIGGSKKYISSLINISNDISSRADSLSEEGKTPLFFMKGDKLLGIIAVADVIKDESPQAVKELQNMGIKVVMLTGDNERTANAVGKLAGVDEVIAGVMPNGKEKVVAELKKQGKVLMVGDGINDAPALTRADIGMAIGSGTDIAIDAADVVLMKSKLTDVPAAVRLSRKTLRNIHENLFWAFIYNVIGIPLAAGVWIPLLGWQLNPMFGAAAMSLSSFCVVTNALRLNFFDITNPKKDRKIKQKSKKDDNAMTKTMKIDGMMCSHCEGRVKQCLEGLSQVSAADVSHEKGTAVVTLSADVSNDVLTKTVEDQGYKVISIS